MPTENMPDSEVLDRILDQTKVEDFWSDTVEFEELRTAVEGGEGDRIIITEGTSERWADVRTLNYTIVAIWDTKWAFDLLREKAPNNGEDLLDDLAPGIVNAPSTQLKQDEFDVARTRGFVESVCELASKLANDTREGNYTFRVFRVMAQSETKLNIGTNPLGRAKEFYGRQGPVRIVTESEEEDSDDESEDVQSAAQANW